jgi:hypothetical protein
MSDSWLVACDRTSDGTANELHESPLNVARLGRLHRGIDETLSTAHLSDTRKRGASEKNKSVCRIATVSCVNVNCASHLLG